MTCLMAGRAGVIELQEPALYGGMAAISVTHIRLELESVTTATLAGLARSAVVLHSSSVV